MTPDQPRRTAATEPTASPLSLWLTGTRVATAPALKGLPDAGNLFPVGSVRVAA
jgi:hypothetical protein